MTKRKITFRSTKKVIPKHIEITHYVYVEGIKFRFFDLFSILNLASESVGSSMIITIGKHEVDDINKVKHLVNTKYLTGLGNVCNGYSASLTEKGWGLLSKLQKKLRKL